MNAQGIANVARGAVLHGDPATMFTDISYDSRTCPPGALFFCVPGARTDGHVHAPEAVTKGASVLVVERKLQLPVTQIEVLSVRDVMGPISAHFFEQPSQDLTVVGVTGTNGKTTTTFLLESAFAAAGMTAGLIGTVETHVAGQRLPVTRTTPEAPDLQRLLGRMRASGVGAAAMEVSSHGLALRRVDGTRFACAVFTNLTQDHLDFHLSMAEYFDAKARLFSRDLSERAAVNIDDEHGTRLAAEPQISTVTFAIDRPADVRGKDITLERTGSRFVAEVSGRPLTVRVPIAGRFNVLNALATLAAFHALGWSGEAAAEGIAKVPGVPGRFEAVEAGQDFTVLVDYAHTPDSLENALRAAAELRRDGARLVCVFGCGGDRDRAKRPLMGRIASALADYTVITSDNPRSEDPAVIIAAIESGAREGGGDYVVVPDRREAIRAAVSMANAGDVVVIAGKGHESGQEFADRIVPFDDRDVARSILEELCSR